MNIKEIEQFKKMLDLEKITLTKELESFAKKDQELEYNWNAKFPNKERGDDQEEAGDAVEYEQLVSLEQKLETKLKDVILAIEKIDKGKNGNYGVCEKCNKKIEEKRLMVCPEAKLCINCNL